MLHSNRTSLDKAMIAGWVLHPPSTLSRSASPSSHVRSYSAAPKAPPDLSSNRTARAISTSALNNSSTNLSASAALVGSSQRSSSYNDEDESMSTIPDPRSRTMSPPDGTQPPSPSHHPDLNDEVATLSNKLINAINHQANLGDMLNQARSELDASRERIRQLEAEAEGHASQITNGSLVDFGVVKAERTKLLASLTEEAKKRGAAEKEKAAIELELENLTTALFEEANKMVSTARENSQRDHEVMEKKNEMLKARLADTKSLLKSHQEQLAELKRVMEQMQEQNEDHPNSSAPPTPGLKQFDDKDDSIVPGPVHAPTEDLEVTPSYPTSFTHLLQPVLRRDLAAYGDFVTLVRSSKNGPGSRVTSGSYGGFSLGLGLGGTSSQPSPVLRHTPSNGSTSSIATSTTVASTPVTPITPASAVSTSTTPAGPPTPLKETRFYKRALAEDIEPTLRLDTAPGLSWLARRSVLNAMCEGTLVVDPMPVPSTAVQKLYVFACSLCGESRKDPKQARTHRFRTSESDTAQRYPLCKYCLGRVRSSCDFLGFLRMLKDGHWRCEDEEAEKNAWEESVRLREQMFWARMGGGVIPVGAAHNQLPEVTPRASEEVEMLKELEETGCIVPRDITPLPDDATVSRIDLGGDEPSSIAAKKRASKNLINDTAEGLWKAAQEDAMEPLPKESELAAASPGTKQVSDETPQTEEGEKSNRASSQSLAVSEPGNKEEKRLSITIPRPE
ncbi:hypothetical protein V500_07807 [Pseudogymnoascus sp. VKM F-4518 (FW-2643)]|nr:hypothetical protein V500_07807 [Pseudogymnoascus sp. VKM F-4518 (FW-2643)]